MVFIFRTEINFQLGYRESLLETTKLFYFRILHKSRLCENDFKLLNAFISKGDNKISLIVAQNQMNCIDRLYVIWGGFFQGLFLNCLQEQEKKLNKN